jgi:membrane protease YdiL (CAAX protease family)
LKDAARLVAYAAASLVLGALLAPLLYWTAQALAARGILQFLGQFEFPTFFHRALLIVAVLLFWPLLKWLGVGSWRELRLCRNRHIFRDVCAGFGIAAGPLLCFGILLVVCGVYSLRASVSAMDLLERTMSAVVVPFIEEPLFRGLLLGILLRANSEPVAVLVSSAVFSILHFLKSPEQTSLHVTWTSGFVAIANSFAQFGEPMLVAAGFTTLFLLGWILADGRMQTRSLWLPIGLHAGWIFASAVFNKVARREVDALPWLGKNLLIGIAPLCVALISWAMMRAWLRHVKTEDD